jgi:hypothetical protein
VADRRIATTPSGAGLREALFSISNHNINVYINKIKYVECYFDCAVWLLVVVSAF